MLRSRASPETVAAICGLALKTAASTSLIQGPEHLLITAMTAMAQFVGRITQVIADSHGDIWFVGERGLFHLNQQTGRITRPPATRHGLSADSVYEDEAGNLWMLTNSPVVGLVKYDRRAERLTSYPLAARAPRAGGVLASTTSGGSLNGMLAADGHNGLWVPSSEGLSYFDRRTERFTHEVPPRGRQPA